MSAAVTTPLAVKICTQAKHSALWFGLSCGMNLSCEAVHITAETGFRFSFTLAQARTDMIQASQADLAQLDMSERPCQGAEVAQK